MSPKITFKKLIENKNVNKKMKIIWSDYWNHMILWKSIRMRPYDLSQNKIMFQWWRWWGWLKRERRENSYFFTHDHFYSFYLLFRGSLLRFMPFVFLLDSVLYLFFSFFRFILLAIKETFLFLYFCYLLMVYKYKLI